MKRFSHTLGCCLVMGSLALVMGQGCPSGTTDPGNNGNNNGDTTQDRGIAAENQRVAFQSQCAQNVITCTVQFPKPKIQVFAGPGQQVTQTAKGFLIQGSGGDGSEIVNLVGSNSGAGNNATALYYAWSTGASDSNPLTLAAGPVFSTEANPSVRLAEGLHYVRLRLQNDIFRDEIQSPTGETILRNTYLFDFVEVEIDVRD